MLWNGEQETNDDLAGFCSHKRRRNSITSKI
jgi:hypothetical protein